MQNITPYIATLCLGAMLFFYFVTAPLIFGKLPSRQAGLLIRAVFPWYYGGLGGITNASVITGVLIASPGITGSTAVFVDFALQLTSPRKRARQCRAVPRRAERVRSRDLTPLFASITVK
jgi:hypothetical protein